MIEFDYAAWYGRLLMEDTEILIHIAFLGLANLESRGDARMALLRDLDSG
jgi:hypothetical protein